MDLINESMDIPKIQPDQPQFIEWIELLKESL